MQLGKQGQVFHSEDTRPMPAEGALTRLIVPLLPFIISKIYVLYLRGRH